MRRHQHHIDGDCPHQAGSSKNSFRHGTEGFKGKLRKVFYGNLTLVGVLSVIWLILRSGRKPSRINYPCQRAALANTALLLGGITYPLAARLPRWIGGDWVASPRVKRLIKAVEISGIAVLVVLVGVSLAGLLSSPGGRSIREMKAAAATLMVPQLRSESAGASNIYVAEGIPTASERGVDELIDVMDANGFDFYKSGGGGRGAGPTGIVAKNDIVLIKVNGEWRWRGETNSDVVKGLINAIVHHPDGFTGEVVIVENGQWDSYMDNRADNRNPNACNAEDINQSFNDVANMFAGSNRVSVYDWTAIQTNSVAEFGSGDTRDGYCYVPEIEEGYPKFTTVYGTRISLRHGYWNGSSYDNSRVKFLNVPVLKDHGGAGVTCSVKHFMGVQDLWKGTQDPPHDPMRTQGIFGKLMLIARFPDLNIADAIWVTPAGGPNAPYDKAVRVNKLLASTDPIALDCYAAKHVLFPISGDPRHNPDTSGSFFQQMMISTRDVLVAGGKQATMDESKMNVYTQWPSDRPPATRYEYLLAEGSTAYGFETWVLVANPNDSPVDVYISYLTDNGCRNRDPVRVPPRSRLTVEAASDIPEQNSGVRVGSDIPVYVERAMYWNQRAEGHDSIGTSRAATDWYLAEGHTADGFETWIEIMNPDDGQARADITYMTPEGKVPGPSVSIPPFARRTVFAADTVPNTDVSARVTSDRPVVVERSVYWGDRRGGHGAPAVKAPVRDWFFAEGSTAWGFETYLLLLNPGTGDATVSCEFMNADGSGQSAEKQVVVPAGSRRTVKVNDVIPDQDVAAKIHSGMPIVAERSMLWPVTGARAGHDTQGMTEPATEVFMPEGCTAYGFETWLLVQNPGPRESTVSVYAMTEGGELKLLDFNLAAATRRSIRLNDYYQGNLSIKVASTRPVACERALYWNGRGGGTCSIGYAR
jgi:Family of unknown function (DUF5719)/Domain of unknown function (DUF362)